MFCSDKKKKKLKEMGIKECENDDIGSLNDRDRAAAYKQRRKAEECETVFIHLPFCTACHRRRVQLLLRHL